MTPSRLAWICFSVLLICPAANQVLRRVLPTMSPGTLTGILWILTDINRLLVIAAIVGLIVSAVRAIRRPPSCSAAASGKRAVPLGVKIVVVWTGIMATGGFFIGFMCLAFYVHQKLSVSVPPYGPKVFLPAPLAVMMSALLGMVAVGLWRLRRWGWRLAVGIYVAFFAVTCFQLLYRHVFPDLRHWMHFYLYPVLLVYLWRPAIRRRFTNQETGTS